MSLTETAYMSRNLIKYGGIGLVVVVVAWSGLVAGVKAYRAAHPPYYPPTTRYGILPKTVFPERRVEKKEFVLELPNDSLPKFLDQAKVYVVYRPLNTFLALEEESKTANNFGFIGKPIEIEQNKGIYEFRNDQLNQKLVINVLDGSFKINYPYMADQTLLATGMVPDKNKAIETAKNYLDQGGKLTTDLDGGEKKVSFWKIEGSNLVPVNSQAEANIVRVDFFRQAVDEGVEIVSSEFGKASVSALVSGSSLAGKKIVEVSYKHTNVDRESFSTYPIKTAEEAWEDLKMGNYWPAVDNNAFKVAIRKMYLAYFEPVTLTNYMQPIFVFEGDNNFVAYVPAITDEWVK